MITDVPLTIRVPDVVVTHTEVYERNPARLDAAEVLLVVEILSEGSSKVDRILKFAEYAEAGIAQYWIIDLDGPASLRAFTLVGDAYELSGEFTEPSRSTSRDTPSPSTRAPSPAADPISPIFPHCEI